MLNDRHNRTGKILAVGALAMGLSAAACHATVIEGPPVREARVECTTELHNRGEVQRCATTCRDHRCRTQCQERERVSRERHCWRD